jgi:NAD(P)-dependent dehydrogenase (short-subunit alcohol dehydrogenase family)
LRKHRNALPALDLTGKVALVTGRNGGIGLGMAEALAQAGASVVIWGTNPAKNAAAVSKLETTGQRIVSEIVNVSDEGAVIAAMEKAVAEFGRVDTVIANAGIGGGGAFAELPTEQWRKVMAVNLDGVFFTLREACKHMKARAEAGDPGGSLVAISSDFRDPRRGSQSGLRHGEGGLVLAGPCDSRRVCPLRRARQRSLAGLDGERNDRIRTGEREVQPAGDFPRPLQDMDGARGFRRNCGLPRFRCLAAPYRRQRRARCRLHDILTVLELPEWKTHPPHWS